MKTTKCLFKELRIPSASFILDVFICKDREYILQILKKRYGKAVPYIERSLPYLAGAIQVYPNKDCKLPEDIRILIYMSEFKRSLLVHEIEHAMIFHSDRLGFELDAHEWVAYFKEYVFEQLENIKSYVSIEEEA